MKISVIILNWKRPENIRKFILPNLEKNNLVDEIIISHGNKNTFFDYVTDKVLIIHRKDWIYNNEFGLSLRFLCGLSAKNKIICFMDDDEIIHYDDFKMCVNVLKNNDNCGIVGKYGRILNYVGKKYEYNTRNVTGIVDIVLTKFMIFHKKLIYDFFLNNDNLDNLLSQSIPYWNGEDIFISLLSRKRFGRSSLFVIKSKHYNKLSEGDVSVSRWSGHKTFRGNFYTECLKILDLQK